MILHLFSRVPTCIFAISLISTLSGCGSDSGPSDPPRQQLQIVDKGDRKISISINQAGAINEEFMDAYNRSLPLNSDYVTLPVDWNSIEPGPNEDFSYIPAGQSDFNQNNWNRILTSGQLNVVNGKLAWFGNTADNTDALLYGRYEMDNDFSVSLDLDLTVANSNIMGFNLSMLLSFTQDAGNGNTCNMGDAYITIVSLTDSSDQHSLAFRYCNNIDGMTPEPAPTVVSNIPSAVTLRLERLNNSIIASYSTDKITYTEIATLGIGSLTSVLLKPARPYLYFGNPGSALVDIKVDNWKIGRGSISYDNPDDRYISGTVFDILAAVEATYALQLAVDVSLSIRTINTVATTLPSDLETLIPNNKVDFSNTLIADRFIDFINHIKSRTPTITYSSVSIGNEIDGYLGTDNQAWNNYKTFVDNVIPRIKPIFGNTVPIGVKATYDGILDPARQPNIIALNQNTDVAMLTYYPLKADFTVRDPADVTDDFQNMVDILSPTGTKKIFLMEVGYPSATVCNSSISKQNNFYKNMFTAWDTHAETIEAVEIVWLTDIDQTTVDEYTQFYGVSAPAFVGYLASLGITNDDATNKPAFDTIRTATLNRKW